MVVGEIADRERVFDGDVEAFEARRFELIRKIVGRVELAQRAL